MPCEVCTLNIGRGPEVKLQHGVMLFWLTGNVGQQKFRNSRLCSRKDSLFLGQWELSKGFRVEQVPVKN